METPLYPNGHPQVAQTAIQQAENLARNLMLWQNKSSLPHDFEYLDRGSMATVGRNLAVVDLHKWHLGGFFAWLIWMSLHLMLILGIKNRFFIFCNWLYNYITRDQSLRLILKGIGEPNKKDNTLQKVQEGLE
jgi:NADH dehydrogenase